MLCSDASDCLDEETPKFVAKAPPKDAELRRNCVRERWRSAKTQSPPPTPESQFEKRERMTDTGHRERIAPPCARYARQWMKAHSSTSTNPET
jgi:hypothetical protein